MHMAAALASSPACMGSDCGGCMLPHPPAASPCSTRDYLGFTCGLAAILLWVVAQVCACMSDLRSRGAGTWHATACMLSTCRVCNHPKPQP